MVLEEVLPVETNESRWTALSSSVFQAGATTEVLVFQWNIEIGWAVDMIASSQSLLVSGVCRAPWLTYKLWAIKLQR